MNNRQLGNLGEKFAREYFIQNGYKILATQYSCRFGEIDLIVMKNKILSFVEVKTRRSIQFVYPSDAVTLKKRRAMEYTSVYYMNHNKGLDYNSYEYKVFELLINEIDEVVI